MMKTIRFFALVLSLSIISLGGASQASSLRCGSRLITPGDFKDKLIEECGEPDFVEVWEEDRIHDYYLPGFEERGRERYGQPRRVIVHVIVEEWTYNHGSHRFMDHVRIENGRVREITSGQYGY